MSILIKGMEMPTNCCQCPVNMEVCKRGYEYLLAHPELYDKRADGCPLVPVPPHGRLIDGDALEIDAQKRMLLCGKNNNQFQKPYEIMRAIALAPTIIPASEEGE